MANAQPIIEVEHLTRDYGDVHAVDDVSFRVNAGEIFGLLGHNGAGKTTTVRMLTGRTRPTRGTARIAGYDLLTDFDKVKPLINAVFEDQNLYERITGRENLRLFCELYKQPASRADELLKLVGLDDAARRRVKTYSSGMKQRLLVARALINNPRVLFLDEPTRGLDPASAQELRQIIGQLSAEGSTVFLTTHYMEEADVLCHRVSFLSHGKIVALDTPRELKLKVGKRRAAKVLLADRSEREVTLDNPEDATRLSEWMRRGEVLTIHSEEGTLADVFIALAGRPL